MLRRTLDILSQIPHIPKVSESLSQNAKRAQYLIDRFPISEMNEILLDNEAEDDDEPAEEDGDPVMNINASPSNSIA